MLKLENVKTGKCLESNTHIDRVKPVGKEFPLENLDVKKEF